MTTLWITGARGVLGTKLVEQALSQGTYDRIIALAHGSVAEAPQHDPITWVTLDIGDRDALRALAESAPPEVIINPAAMTNVDACETRADEAVRANVDGPRYLAEISRERGTHLLHVSTDYVFPGDASNPGPYREDAPTHAVSVYGQTKLDGEKAIMAECGNDTPYTIVRTAIVYGFIPGGRSNFVTWLAQTLRSGQRARIVTDQFNTPTIAEDLAALLLWQAANHRTGIYHGAGPDLISRAAWAVAIAQHFDLDTGLIDSVTTAQLNQPAPRPLQSGLLCERLVADQAQGAPIMRGIDAGLTEIPWLSA